MSNSLLSQIIENINNSKFHEAEQLAWELYNKSNNDFTIIKTLALTLLLQNKYNGAIDFYQKAEKINSNDFDVIELAQLIVKFNNTNSDKPNDEFLDAYTNLREYALSNENFNKY